MPRHRERIATIPGMQSLNLSGDQKKSDGRLKSLFWPAVENAWDVDYLGQQGFWICLFIAVISLVWAAIPAFEIPNLALRGLALAIGAIVSFMYLVGGMGVRQSSWPAALAVFFLYAIDQVSTGRVGVLSIIIGAVLLSNVRATILASRWKPATEDEDRPTRFNETFRDKLVDQLPPRAWPIAKYPFYILAVLLLVLMLAGNVMRLLHFPKAVPNENDTPSVTVSPSEPR